MNNLTLNSKHFLGKLCARQHNWNSSGYSLRYTSVKSCVECHKILDERRKERNKQERIIIGNGEYLKDLPLEERRKHIDVSSPCQLAEGKVNKDGYVYVKSGLYIGCALHRTVLMQYLDIGYVPKTLDACHACNNKLCINPLHIYFGSRTENMQDATIAGRTNRGRKCNFCILSESQVWEICELLDKKVSEAKIAKLFNVAQATIHLISTGENWGWLTGRKPKEKEIKRFVAIDPNGLLHYFQNIETFALSNEMKYMGIYKALKGLRTHYKGWKFYQVFQ
ncbi:MAG: hypothetical protein ACRCZS_06775 [Chroococcidiopsis sp.]